MSTRVYIATICLVAGLALAVWGGSNPTVQAAPPSQDAEDLVERGRYLTSVAGCLACHTPYQEKYADFSQVSLEDWIVAATADQNALDQDRLFAGGRPFDLGPQGVIFTRNLTSDPETGLGDWSDEEIKQAITLGISKDGRQLHPLMPYLTFNRMADSDVDAVIAFLRTLDPIENEVPLPAFQLPSFGLTRPEEGIVAPDPSDIAAWGEYLMTGVTACTDCHTPLDPETGEPMLEMYLGGGQPYEGPWGIVYGTNITSHEGTGLGTWSETDMYRAISAGVRPDGRRLILMPWQDYAQLTTADLEAIVYHLRNTVPPVDNEVPAPALNEGFEIIVEITD